MWKRFVGFADRHAWIVTLAGVAFMMVVLGLSLQRQNDQSIQRAKREAEDRSIEIARTSIQTCQSVVVTITAQSKTDDIKMIDAIKDRYGELGRPVPAALLEAENTVLQRQAPTAACVPKENP